ncbi:MAG: hypothetical protein AAF585_07960 [Verrucomicrobiota bacterium]
MMKTAVMTNSPNSTPDLSRRTFIAASASAAAAVNLSGADAQSGLRLATFHYDVTPPIGHSLCGGWIKPVDH